MFCSLKKKTSKLLKKGRIIKISFSLNDLSHFIMKKEEPCFKILLLLKRNVHDRIKIKWILNMELILNTESVKILVDDKRHIRFGTWSAADIEVYFFEVL